MGEREYRYDADKNELLIRERGIGFERIIELMQGGKIVRVVDHPNQPKYPGQVLIEVDVDGYVHVVPAVIEKSSVFLKTIYASRKATRINKSAEGQQTV